MKIKFMFIFFLSLVLNTAGGYAKNKAVFFCGSVKNDLYLLLSCEGFKINLYRSPFAAIDEAPKRSAVFIVSDTYPLVDETKRITQEMLNIAAKKKLQLYIEYPASYPGLNLTQKPVETRLERGVITSDVFGPKLLPMSLLGIHNCHVLPVNIDNPLIVLAKVVGFDKAEYGLDSTKAYPLLFEKGNSIIAMTSMSNFATGRYGPNESVKQVWTYILSRMLKDESFKINHWFSYVSPTYSKNEILPVNARVKSIQKGANWYYNGRFFVHPTWKQDWLKYGSNGSNPVGPPVGKDKLIGDGNLGVIEGHTSTINYDGTQRYRYWMRGDVQGEVSMTLAAAGSLLNNKDYKKKSANLIDYLLKTSNLRAGAKNDSNSAAYGLIGWATTNSGTFYGDDNARSILGMIAASSYLNSNKWDKEIAEAILGNFRTTGKKGFRGERLEEEDILKNGWKYYWNRDYIHLSPHFESWMWACYLWLYHKTGYQPLLDKTKTAIRLTMEAYPKKWLWGSSLQSQRAQMILPLAWLVRIEDTEEHRRWLDIVVSDMLRCQATCGAIREEVGEGKGQFKELKSNKDYGTDEGSMIFKNDDPVADMLAANNFALFSLNEAAHATGNRAYKAGVDKLSDFLTRIQINSEKYKDLDGGWFRGFDYSRWDYWASNSDAGWGAWCTLTGWSQSWIVATQVQVQENQSYWGLTRKSEINKYMQQTVKLMFGKE
ncbi:hypothetical protein [Mucilaginibacter boryungensis]|nr:hypothetical protein [Mucilaginibacter boryungensis]